MGIFDKLKNILAPTPVRRKSEVSGPQEYVKRKLGVNVDSHKDLAHLLDVAPESINYYAFKSKDSYRIKEVPKKDGSPRKISIPKPQLKRLQGNILECILNEITFPEPAHGFVLQRSIVSNASPHVGSKVVVGLDLKDFFPSITTGRVIGAFSVLGFSKGKALRLAKICTHENCLPQGAPTSPAISNLVCSRLDARLAGLAAKHGLNYTRYADDITFSGEEKVVAFLPLIQKIIQEEGFEVARKKTRIMRSGGRQKVTGLVVNEKVAVPRETRRWLRAVIHKCLTKGPQSITAETQNLRTILSGYAAFIKSVDSEKARIFFEQLRSVNW